MKKSNSRRASPISEAEADPPLFTALARDLPGLPAYDPAVEITARDVSRDPARNTAYDRAKRELDKLVKAGTWTAREVMLPAGHKATAYRPKTPKGTP
jgi:hypothetical protein